MNGEKQTFAGAGAAAVVMGVAPFGGVGLSVRWAGGSVFRVVDIRISRNGRRRLPVNQDHVTGKSTRFAGGADPAVAVGRGFGFAGVVAGHGRASAAGAVNEHEKLARVFARCRNLLPVAG